MTNDPDSMNLQEVRVVMHAHSEWSYDADWPLERIAQVMPRLGAQVVLMSEHDTGFPADRFAEYRAACQAASTSRCLLIPGIEYSDPQNDVHLPTWGVDRFLGESRPTPDLLHDVAAQGGASIFAHPARRDAWAKYDADWTGFLAAIEVWNRKSDGVAPGKEAIKLMRKTGLKPVVGMDFHRRNQLWPLTNRLTVRGEINERSITEALGNGQFVPCAFGFPVTDAKGEIRQTVHRKAEALRRALKPLFRRRG